MLHRCIVRLLAAAVVCVGAVVAPVAAQTWPVAATGWNRDIVVESTAAAPYAGAAMSFDVGNNYSWYESGMPGSAKGLPAGGGFNSAADASIRVQLQPYTASNALFLDAGAPSGALTLAPAAQIRYDRLVVVASSAGGGGTGTLVITFTDASTSAAINFNAPDWFNNTTNNAVNNLGRVSLTTDATDDGSLNNPRLYQTVINLASLGLNTVPVASVTFTKPASGAATVIMAISGQRAVTALAPVETSGYNRDIVVENTAVSPYSGFAMSFDTFNGISWFERGLGTSTKGLPVGGAFVSLSNAAIQGQLQPYNASNALFLDSVSPSGLLNFGAAARRPYEFLAVFACSSNGGGIGTMEILFTDGSTSGPLNFNAQDWFNVTTNNALNDLGRVSLVDDTFHEPVGNPRIYQTLVDMISLGLSTRAVDRISFTKPDIAGAQNTVVMGVSGQVVQGVVGACRYPDGTCALLPQANCTGTYDGDNTACPPSGACVAASGDCTLRTQANCVFVSGNYLGDNTACPAPGACIAASGNCTQLNTFQCAVQGGTFLGAGTACPAPGACCAGGGCTVLNSFQCAFQGGTFQGTGTTCDYSYPAITVGGSALEDISTTGAEVAWTTGSSDDGRATVAIGFTFPFFSSAYTEVSVVTNGFITLGTLSTDFGNDCPAPSASTPNSAIYPFWIDMHVGAVDLDHPGRVYTEMRTSPNRFIVQWNRVGQYNLGDPPLDENTFQVVLFENGNIELRYGALSALGACDATVGIENATGTVGLNYDNTLLGAGAVSLSIAAQNPCPQGPTTGACCLGATCSATTSATCTGPNIRYAGDGTTCNAPGNNSTPCCRADYNQSGGITVQDIFDFLGGYFTTNPAADINNSGGVTVQDIFDYLGAYFAGCN